MSSCSRYIEGSSKIFIYIKKENEMKIFGPAFLHDAWEEASVLILYLIKTVLMTVFTARSEEQTKDNRKKRILQAEKKFLKK